jgi:S-adenosylmethionine-diacylgycerolhomoserine-N-methlytransferase
MSSTLRTADAASVASTMDRIYRHQRHIYDLTRKYYLLGRDGLIKGLEPPRGGSVLEIGCGTGRNLIQAAGRYRDADFFGVDISSEMLTTGRAKVEAAGLGGRIRLAEGDATGFDALGLLGRDRFDRIFISYALSMIPDWRGALAHTLDRLAPDGKLMVVDFGQQEDLPVWFRGALFAWLRRFHVTPRAELCREIAALAQMRGFAWKLRPLYRGYAWSGVVEARSTVPAATD